MERPIKKLVKLDTLGVSLVTRGANRKRFALTKDETGEVDMTVKELLARLIEKGDMSGLDEGTLDKMCADNGLDSQGAETFKAIVKLSQTYKDSEGMKKLLMSELPKVMGYQAATDEPKDTPAADAPAPKDEPTTPNKEDPMAGEKDKTTVKTEPAAGTTSPAADDKTVTQKSEAAVQVTEDRLAKLEGLLKTQQDLIAKSDERAKGAEDALKLVRDEQRLSGWVTKAEKELQFYPGKSAAELGASLKSMEDLDPKMAEAQFLSMKAASAAIQKSAAFAPAGTVTGFGGSAPASAWAAIEKSAEGFIQKSADEPAEVIKARAIVKALEMNKELYDQYMQEHPEQFGSRVRRNGIN